MLIERAVRNRFASLRANARRFASKAKKDGPEKTFSNTVLLPKTTFRRNVPRKSRAEDDAKRAAVSQLSFLGFIGHSVVVNAVGPVVDS